MKIKASELKAGDIIEIVYGDYGNNVNAEIISVKPYGYKKDHVCVEFKCNKIQSDFIASNNAEFDLAGGLL